MRQYQVVVFGDDGVEASNFREQLASQFTELEIDNQLLRFVAGSNLAALDPRSPAVGVYFALSPYPASSDPDLTKVLLDGYTVVPVVRDLKQFSKFVPDALRPVNGFEIDASDPKLARLCDVVLENLSLLRRSRRLFISYRRQESQRVAIHLYEELDRRTFDVFLDTHSIRPGEPFQEVLWHRLADTDVMVLLDSPGFLGNRWTEEELARANSTSLQILQVIWPGHLQKPHTAFSHTYQLSANDFVDPAVTLGVDARLSDAAAQRIALEAESLRARALAARRAYLVQEMFREATAIGADLSAQPGRYLKLETQDGAKAIIVPTVGVPDALKYQEIEEDIAEDGVTDLMLVYDERGVRDRWLKHLAWLDPQLKVRSLPIGKVAAWMAGRVTP
jgi:hypothetical protein